MADVTKHTCETSLEVDNQQVHQLTVEEMMVTEDQIEE